jgi:hypothetical protein
VTGHANHPRSGGLSNCSHGRVLSAIAGSVARMRSQPSGSEVQQRLVVLRVKLEGTTVAVA